MNKPSVAAEPEIGIDIPSFEDLASDPEIAPLLDFAPVPRQMTKRDGWTPAAQRIFIAWLAHYGSPTHACLEVGKARSGIDKIYRSAGADEFRAAWDGAVALFERRRIAKMTSGPGGHGALRAPTPARGRIRNAPYAAPLAPGEVYNEHGLPEDGASFNRRGEEARESIGTKLLRCRRALLAEISRDPGKRAAFELLTELPIDWAKARRLEAQDDEPWRTPRMLEADMVVTAENGWFGTIVPDYGPDKIGPLREAINRARAERGQPAIDQWSQEPDDDAEEEVPCLDLTTRHSRDGGNPADSIPPEGPRPIRSFGLNSQEFYDAVAKPGRWTKVPTRDSPGTRRSTQQDKRRQDHAIIAPRHAALCAAAGRPLFTRPRDRAPAGRERRRGRARRRSRVAAACGGGTDWPASQRRHQLVAPPEQGKEMRSHNATTEYNRSSHAQQDYLNCRNTYSHLYVVRSVTLTSLSKAPYIMVMVGAEPMLKYAAKARKRPVRAAKRSAKRVDIRATYRDTMKRFPKTMALLAE